MSKKTHNNLEEVQGTPVGDVTLKQVKEWTKNDVARCLSFLNAIYSDPDLIDHIATFMYGRLQNDLERKRREEAEKNQVKMFEE